MDVRLVAIDIDGTLLDSRGQIPDANVAAIAAALDAGVHVALVTGRSFPFAREAARPLPNAITLIVSNGAVERTMDGETVATRLLPRTAAREVLLRTEAWRHVSALIFNRDVEGHVVAETMDWGHPNRRRYWEGRQHMIARAAPLEDALHEDPVQVMFNGGVDMMRDVHAALEGVPDVAVCRTEYVKRDFALVDVTSPSATKGRALAWRAEALGLAPHHVMAIGDNMNDLEMLEYAGVPVVMANAVDELRCRGWNETASHDEAGVAAAIHKWVLG